LLNVELSNMQFDVADLYCIDILGNRMLQYEAESESILFISELMSVLYLNFSVQATRR